MAPAEPERDRPVHGTAVDPLVFREVLATFPAGVVVVTAAGPAGIPAGLTVSAFCSVSAEPPLVLVCIDKGSNTLPAIQHAGAYTVNILAAERQGLALTFASKQGDKFASVAWESTRLVGGGPILHEDAAAHAVCVVREAIEAGDHWVFIGEVVEAAVTANPSALLYHQRTFAAVG